MAFRIPRFATMTDREQALKFKNEGNAAFSARDFDKAIELFTKVRAPPLERPTPASSRS